MPACGIQQAEAEACAWRAKGRSAAAARQQQTTEEITITVAEDGALQAEKNRTASGSEQAQRCYGGQNSRQQVKANPSRPEEKKKAHMLVEQEEKVQQRGRRIAEPHQRIQCPSQPGTGSEQTESAITAPHTEKQKAFYVRMAWRISKAPIVSDVEEPGEIRTRLCCWESNAMRYSVREGAATPRAAPKLSR